MGKLKKSIQYPSQNIPSWILSMHPRYRNFLTIFSYYLVAAIPYRNTENRPYVKAKDLVSFSIKARILIGITNIHWETRGSYKFSNAVIY